MNKNKFIFLPLLIVAAIIAIALYFLLTANNRLSVYGDDLSTRLMNRFILLNHALIPSLTGQHMTRQMSEQYFDGTNGATQFINPKIVESCATLYTIQSSERLLMPHVVSGTLMGLARVTDDVYYLFLGDTAQYYIFAIHMNPSERDEYWSDAKMSDRTYTLCGDHYPRSTTQVISADRQGYITKITEINEKIAVQTESKSVFTMRATLRYPIQDEVSGTTRDEYLFDSLSVPVAYQLFVIPTP